MKVISLEEYRNKKKDKFILSILYLFKRGGH